MFVLETSLYPKRILIKVNILMPPSIGIHGGGQQEGNPGWGCVKKKWGVKTMINKIKYLLNNKLLFISITKICFNL